MISPLHGIIFAICLNCLPLIGVIKSLKQIKWLLIIIRINTNSHLIKFLVKARQRAVLFTDLIDSLIEHGVF